MMLEPRFGRLSMFGGLLAAVLITACSGGGGSSSAPAASGPPLGGIGSTVAFNQAVNFTVLIPPATTTSAVAVAARQRRASATTTNPYVSPKTASIQLQVVTVNGISPKVLPVAVVTNITCTGNAGCSVPIQGVPAATGVNHFSVQTFSGPNGTGNQISVGYVDVTAPSAQATSFGGTALTIGGFVESLSLTLNAPTTGFKWHTASAGTLDVNAIDPAGAIIIGSDILANPISVSLPTSDESAFTLAGAQAVTLQQPAAALALAYNGTVLFGGTVTASTTNQNSQPVTASLAIPVSAPPTPTPAPVPSSKPPLSLYVFDASADRILEYSGVNTVEGGGAFSTTPRRIFEIAAPNGNIVCPTVDGTTPAVASMAVSSVGEIYVQTYCTDTTQTNGYTFDYPASTQEAVPAQGTPTPPVPDSTFSLPSSAGVGSALGTFAQGIKLNETSGTIFEQFQNSYFLGSNIIGVALANPATVTTNFGATCFEEFGASTQCASDPTAAYGVYAPFNFAVDSNGYIYQPNSYNETTDVNGNVILPPGSAAQAFIGEAAILTFQAGNTNPAPTPLSALAGFSDELGSSVVVDAIEGTNLYALADGPGAINPAGVVLNNPTLNPGLSGCPAPSASATPDSSTNACVDGNPHSYIAGFANATTTLTAAANSGQNVVAGPTFMLGGDQVGGFGDGVSTPGDLIAVRDGFAFVLNPLPPSGGAPEIDVYNTNGLTGFHTDTPPVAKLVLNSPIVPTTIAIGATGTGVGGEALLRRPARAHHDIKAWARQLEQRRKALLQRRMNLRRQ